MPNHTASKSCAQLAVCEKARIQLTLVVGANLRIIQKIVWEETCGRENSNWMGGGKAWTHYHVIHIIIKSERPFKAFKC